LWQGTAHGVCRYWNTLICLFVLYSFKWNSDSVEWGSSALVPLQPQTLKFFRDSWSHYTTCWLRGKGYSCCTVRDSNWFWNSAV
jgi:hypothetical protein